MRTRHVGWAKPELLIASNYSLQHQVILEVATILRVLAIYIGSAAETLIRIARFYASRAMNMTTATQLVWSDISQSDSDQNLT